MTEATMLEFFYNHGQTLIFWSAITLMCVVPTISHYWWKIRKTEMETSLKHDMLARGMSAEDIERVLLASADRPVKKQPPSRTAHTSDV